MKISYITVSSTAANVESSEMNIGDIIQCIEDGYEIISAIGDGTGQVHYILTKPDATGLPSPRLTRKVK